MKAKNKITFKTINYYADLNLKLMNEISENENWFINKKTQRLSKIIMNNRYNQDTKMYQNGFKYFLNFFVMFNDFFIGLYYNLNNRVKKLKISFNKYKSSKANF